MRKQQAARMACVLTGLVLIFTGCAQGQQEQTPAEATVTQADTGTGAGAGAERTSSTAGAGASSLDTEEDSASAAVNAVAEDLSFIRFSNTTTTQSDTSEENERAVVRMTRDMLTIENTASDGKTALTALSRKVSELEYIREQECDAEFEAYRETAGNRNNREKYDCSLQRQISVLRADTRVFSFLEEHITQVDTAGASVKDEENTYTCISHNLDAESAKEIRLTDVVNDPERFSELAAEAVLEKYDTNNPAYNARQQFEGIDLQETILALFENGETEGTFAWAPAYYGLRLVFARKAVCDEENLASYLDEVSELNAHDLHCFDVTVPYTTEGALFEASYTELPPFVIARLENGVTYLADTGDGPLPLQIATPRKYENNTVLYTGECTVRIGENTRQSFDLTGAEEYGNLGVCVYLVKAETGNFLYVDVTGRDETDRLHVYAIEGGSVRFVGVSEEMLDNYRLPPFDPAYFMTEGICYILPDPFLPDSYTGTRGFRESRVSAGGMPESDDRFYLVAEEDVRTTAIDLTLDTLRDENDDRPEKESYPAGTTLSMWRVDRTSHADLVADDGRIVRLYINGVDTIDLIDGHELNEAFADPRLEGED